MTDELPGFLKRDRVRREGERFIIEETFSSQELRHLPAALLIAKVADRAARYMDLAGAMGPYVYSCKPWLDWFILRCEEC